MSIHAFPNSVRSYAAPLAKRGLGARETPEVDSVVGNRNDRGGDRAFAFRCPDGIVHVFVADVAGNGDAAHAAAEFLAQSVRTLVCQGMSLPLVLQTLDYGLSHFFDDDALFATAFLASVGAERLSYVSAGHPDAFLFDANRHHVHVPATGPALGVFMRPTFALRSVDRPSSSTLAVVTDGVTEARIGERERLGEHGVTKLVAQALRSGDARPAHAADRAFRAIATSIDDDYAIVTVAL